MTTPETNQQAVDDYVEAVRSALSDLPADDVADLVADVAEHLDQVRSEFDGEITPADLHARLGAPSDYAAELRRSAGLAGTSAATADGSAPKVALTRRVLRFLSAVLAAGAVGLLALAVVAAVILGGAAITEDLMVLAVVAGVGAAGGFTLLLLSAGDRSRELAAMPGASVLRQGVGWFEAKPWSDDVVAFVVSLRPAWWVLRAALVTWLVTAVLGAGIVSAAPLFLLSLVASIWLGRLAVRGRVRGRSVYASYALNAGLGVAAVVAAFSLTTAGAGVVQFSDGVEYAGSYPVDEGYEAGYDEYDEYGEYGEPVTNLYAYDAEGNLIDQVRLYDQHGRPFELTFAGDCAEVAYGEVDTVESPWGPNVFPRGVAEFDERTGECVVGDPKPPFGVALPGATVPTPTVPTPTVPTPTVPAPTPTVPTPVPSPTKVAPAPSAVLE